MNSTVETQKARPMLFNAEMVRAILASRKTQTRRRVEIAEVYEPDFGKPMLDKGWIDTSYLKREYGNVPCLKIRFDGNGKADMRTQHRHFPPWDNGALLWVRETFALHDDREPPIIYYRADDQTQYESDGAWRPSIHMPRWASRITLEITKIRVERLQDISEADAEAEGVNPITAKVPTHKDAFRYLWDDINGEGAWNQNPWVWVIEFCPSTSTDSDDASSSTKKD
jgi:hypothetical protein